MYNGLWYFKTLQLSLAVPRLVMFWWILKDHPLYLFQKSLIKMLFPTLINSLMRHKTSCSCSRRTVEHTKRSLLHTHQRNTRSAFARKHGIFLGENSKSSSHVDHRCYGYIIQMGFHWCLCNKKQVLSEIYFNTRREISYLRACHVISSTSKTMPRRKKKTTLGTMATTSKSEND